MNGLQRVARRAILTRQKAHAGLTTLVPATRLYPQTVPANPDWPFARLGVPQSAPITATCLNGATVTIPWDAFAKPRFSGARMVETAEDHAARIGAAFEAAIHLKGELVDVDGQPARLTYALSDMRLFQDGDESDAFHYSALIRVRAVAE